MRSPGSPRLERRDDLAGSPGAHLWLVWDGDRLAGAVARAEGFPTWHSGRVGPARGRPWADTLPHRTRREAVERLAGGAS